MNDFTHVGTGERELSLEAPHDLGDVLRRQSLEGAEHAFEIGLRRDEDPGPPVADRAQGLCHRLQVQHEFGVLADKLADLVDEEV